MRFLDNLWPQHFNAGAHLWVGAHDGRLVLDGALGRTAHADLDVAAGVWHAFQSRSAFRHGQRREQRNAKHDGGGRMPIWGSANVCAERPKPYYVVNRSRYQQLNGTIEEGKATYKAEICRTSKIK